MGTTVFCDYGESFDEGGAFHAAEGTVRVTTKREGDATVHTAFSHDACSVHMPLAVNQGLGELAAVPDGHRLEAWWFEAVGGKDTRSG